MRTTKKRYVLYYPPGQTLIDGEAVDNCVLAERLMRARGSVSLALPEGWRLVELDGNIVAARERGPDDQET